ncbi:MAG: RNA polymerase sigma factor [Chloroflexaceae bacterium]|jgi:RNA polymerase sigma-70 factor (ECF subfamily)|nr:RNA polymerase sigma factor [Chloroflexaceae bacterium]
MDIEGLYTAHRPGMLRHLRRLVGDSATAEDLCQETFVRALRAGEQLHVEQQHSWLYRVATNLAYDHLRRCKRRPLVSLLSVEPFAAAPATEGCTCGRVALRMALAHLPPASHHALLLHVAGYTIAEIARQQGCAEGTVKSRLSRGRAVVQARLAIGD